MISGSLGRRYAKAILQIGLDQKNSEAIGDELEQVVALMESAPELRTTLASLLFPLDKRHAILEEVATRMKLSSIVRSFLRLLLDKSRIASLGDIARVYRTLLDEQLGIVRATVTAPRPISSALEKRLTAQFEKQSGKRVILQKREDPELIGGLVAQLGDMVYDGSVRSRLQKLRAQLQSD